MITQRDMDNILKDVNRVFTNLEEKLDSAIKRIEELENSGKTSSTTTSTTSKAKSQ